MSLSTEIESLWVFALASKCSPLTQPNVLYSFLFLFLIWFLVCIFHWAHPGGPAWGRHPRCRRNSPLSTTTIPGPRGLPVIGSMTLMTGLAHHRIAAMAKSLGATRLMAFSLANTRVIVTCNPDVAKEILNSSVFVDRPIKESAYSLMFNRAIGFAPYDVYWRTLRRIASQHLFCPKQIKSSEFQRRQIASQMVAIFANNNNNNHTSSHHQVRDTLKRASLNHMMGSVFGQAYNLSDSNNQIEQLKSLVDEGYDLLGLLNWSDHLPFLADLDPQRIRFRCSRLVPKVNRFLNRIIADHRSKSTQQIMDFVDVLLSLQQTENLSDSDIIAVLWEMIFRGTDTVAVLIEWTLARMVVHKEEQEKVQEELDKVVGRSRAVVESDIPSLEYLTAVVKEVLRLHPPGPLLSWARLARSDTVVDGHHVPRGTTAMINMWSIARDPEVWWSPQEFMPERFVGNKCCGVEFSIMGSDLRLAPFGSGRRSCPGKALAWTTVTFWVATLLHEFKWWQNDDVDLCEKLKLSCEMANPLTVKVSRRR
ncbi:cytochrome P450 78A3-like [Cucurbita pepo subsp. pepo]|uniref:cytochrome P450 78A3-like n=1 Tax=Cucurbita pepo subsp. pepo TaxID=3664 RepID=UPI000C9D2F74|nr:cytochrome P450 78A3-like [Cucurbita pepo subsp. pepo]